MIRWERRVLLRHYLDLGLTVAEISRELDISRQTVCRRIKSGELDREVEKIRHGPCSPVPTKLNPYKGSSETGPPTLGLVVLSGQEMGA